MLVLELLRDRGPLTRAVIARQLGLNPASVTRIVDELLTKGLVLERPPELPKKQRVGRPPVWIEFNSQSSLVAGVDLGDTFIQAALLDLAGSVLRRVSVRAEPGNRGVATVVKLLEDLMCFSTPLRSRLGAVVIGVPGVVIPKDGVVVSAPSLGWRNLSLKHLLEQRVQIPVIVENDVNLRALGEQWRGAGRGSSHLVYVFAGTGIGTGIIVNGELYRGATYSAGEIGYFLPEVCYVGQEFKEFGCLEYLASGFGIAERARTAVLAGKGEGILKKASSPWDINAAHVLAAYQKGDAIARKIVDEAQRFLALALANLTCVLNPEIIVLGGDIVESGVLDLHLFRSWIAKAVPFIPKIVVSALGGDAGLLGAVALALRSTEFLENLLDRSEEGAERGRGWLPRGREKSEIRLMQAHGDNRVS